MKEIDKDRLLLKLEFVILTLSCLVFFATSMLLEYVEMDETKKILLVILSFLPFLYSVYYAIKIEQVAGFYECANCHHKYVPTFKDVAMAPHFGRTRKLMCPKCNEKTWSKKVLK